jgi:hypothetical protein
VAAAERETASTPMTFKLPVKEANGIPASTLTAEPFAHVTTLHVCSAEPVLVIVPNGYSTDVAVTPLLLIKIHTFASTTPLPPLDIKSPNPSLLILLTFELRFSSQRTYKCVESVVRETPVKSPEPPPASVLLSTKFDTVVQSAIEPSIVMVAAATRLGVVLVAMIIAPMMRLIIKRWRCGV